MSTPLTEAFKNLRKAGYFARQNFTCCQTCGWYEVPEEKSKKVVFYHAQDKQRLDQSNETYLSWAGSATEIMTILNAHPNLVAQQDAPEQRIRVMVCD